MNTRGYGGRTLKKNIAVITNDPVNPHGNLQITGLVEKFVTISPRLVRLVGKKGDIIKSTVKIIPEKEYPFSILSVKARNGKSIRYSIEKAKGKEKVLLLHVENIKKDAGSYRDSIILKTDSKIMPEISILVFARIIDPNDKRLNQRLGPINNKVSPGKVNPFAELIKKMQKQKALKQGKTNLQVQDPARAEELKKKFEDAIKRASKK